MPSAGDGKCPIPDGCVPLRASVPFDMSDVKEKVSASDVAARERAEQEAIETNDFDALAQIDTDRFGVLAPLLRDTPPAPRYRKLTPQESAMPMSDVRRLCPRRFSHTCTRNCAIAVSDAADMIVATSPPSIFSVVPRRGIYVNHYYEPSWPCLCGSEIPVSCQIYHGLFKT